MEPVKYDTITIMKKAYCRNCGWPIISVCCNGSFQNFKDAKNWDWWAYCSNKGCKNHDGEGVSQDDPEWIERQK